MENVRQEMPQAHLELLHSGSLCVTAEAFGVLPAHSVISRFVLNCHCLSRREKLLCVNELYLEQPRVLGFKASTGYRSLGLRSLCDIVIGY